VIGGSGTISGGLSTTGSIGRIVIQGNLVGGPGVSSGGIFSEGNLGPITIGGDIQGGNAKFAGSIESSLGRIAGVTVDGSIRAGLVATTATIRAGQDLGPLLVKGSLLGSTAVPIVITAVGAANPTPGLDVAFHSLTVLGRVEFTDFLAGYNRGLNSTFTPQPVNADAQIGKVFVGGDWIASNLVAGVAAGTDGQFGTADDVLIPEAKQDPNTTATIGKVVINGQVQGTANVTTDHFGIVAQLVTALRIGGTTIALTPGPDNDTSSTSPSLNLAGTQDVRVLEV
jgi:hypothetical protein